MARKTSGIDGSAATGNDRRPWLGSHLSIAGGIHHALEAVETLGCDCVQVFTKNQRQWKSKPLADVDVVAWKAGLERLGWNDRPNRVVSHNSYLVNMASPDPEATTLLSWYIYHHNKLLYILNRFSLFATKLYETMIQL